MSARHDSSDGPEDIDAAFAEIVADLERDTKFGKWPGEDDAEQPAADERTTPSVGAPDENKQVEPPAEQGPRDWAPAAEEEGHFVPPEPPPLPIPRPATFLGVGIVVLGVLVLLIPGLAGIAATVKLPLGLVLISTGIGLLLFRLRHTPPSDSDDGAQV